MPKHCPPFKLPYLAVVLAGLSLCAGCLRESSGPKTYAMGDRASAGTLIYSVIEAEWSNELGQSPTARTPKNTFLILRVNITNSGAAEAAVPLMTLVDPSGRTYEEERNGEGVPEWLGVLRKVKAAETENGRVIFDAPRGDYQLRVTDDAFDPEQIKVALIQIPLRFQSGPPDIPR